MDPSTEQMAEYFNVSTRLYPHLAELLADLSELGSDPSLVVAWLESRKLGAGSRVLDLGCGKGAVGIAIAETLGASVDGVDACAPFIDEAKRRAAERGVAALCDFRVGDLREAVRTSAVYDAALYVSVGLVLGTLGESVAAVRRCVRPGGVIVIDDAYCLAGPVEFPGYEYIAPREETLAQLTAHGDRILAERLITREEMRAQNQKYQAWIERRGRELAAREPDLTPDIEAYFEAQRQECAILENDLQGASWMLERI